MRRIQATGRASRENYDPANADQVLQIRLWDARDALAASIAAGVSAGATDFVSAAESVLDQLHALEELL